MSSQPGWLWPCHCHHPRSGGHLSSSAGACRPATRGFGSESTKERRTSAGRYTGSRQSLIAQLTHSDLGINRHEGSPPAQGASVVSGPLRAVIYLRVSTEEQAKVGGTAEGYSIPYQRRACTEKAESKHSGGQPREGSLAWGGVPRWVPAGVR